MKNEKNNELKFWVYKPETYMVKIPFDEILSFKNLLGFKTKKEASSSKFLSNYIIYKEGLKGKPIYIQTQIEREKFDSFLKENRKELREKGIEIIKLKQ
jgi:hypothetical protein